MLKLVRVVNRSHFEGGHYYQLFQGDEVVWEGFCNDEARHILVAAGVLFETKDEWWG